MVVNLKKHIRRHSVVFVFWRSIFDLFFITTKVQNIYLLLCLSNIYIRYPIFTFGIYLWQLCYMNIRHCYDIPFKRITCESVEGKRGSGASWRSNSRRDLRAKLSDFKS